jgi:hypothetical protein
VRQSRNQRRHLAAKNAKGAKKRGLTTKDTKFKRIISEPFVFFVPPLKIRGVRMGCRIVAWMERSGIQEGDVGHGRGNGVRE